MRNFHRLAQGMDFGPLVNAITRNPQLWDQNTLRTTHPATPHHQVSDIWVRFNSLDEFEKTGNPEYIIDQHESIWFPAASLLPVRPLLFDLMRTVEGERLGRVIITRLAPGCAITPHVDSGDHAAYYTRYQLALYSLPGNIFRCGNETVQMKTGEVWYFNNGLEHEVVNNSADDRLALIVDVRHS
jgi:hypothetical protein